MESVFEPVILSFCCRWCSYAAADLAGSMRLQYPANVRILMVPCTGRVDIIHILKAFEEGVDGVFLSGCLIGDCHYLNGNVRATKRVERVKQRLVEMGLDPGRVEIYYNSSAMGPQFAQTCRDFTERIRKMGPVYPQGRPEWPKGEITAQTIG
jgi:F420-non-reducing hydrogenase iron-sulfur subunit